MYHPCRAIVFIQPGVEDMSIILCDFNVLWIGIDHDHVKAIFNINTLHETTFCYILP